MEDGSLIIPRSELTAAELLAERRAEGLTAADVPKAYPDWAYGWGEVPRPHDSGCMPD